ncbi:hypothetical protein TI39_contig313g00022 [Zymoseptoria brevis]|uniref:Sulfatase N-terminal domain-containing protein n=1 Tax=Zymoseptoria brevis TaxID=1047168 RepID=A0A0F4GX16_9PEZI|nr:hypothetical protein TI39_contig313g00022 [Zymoseptoria brevis]
MADQLAAPQLKILNEDPQIKTPNLDKLAERSVVFDSAYCKSPLRAPSRMDMITGQLPPKIGAYDDASPRLKTHHEGQRRGWESKLIDSKTATSPGIKQKTAFTNGPRAVKPNVKIVCFPRQFTSATARALWLRVVDDGTGVARESVPGSAGTIVNYPQPQCAYNASKAGTSPPATLQTLHVLLQPPWSLVPSSTMLTLALLLARIQDVPLSPRSPRLPATNNSLRHRRDQDFLIE